MSWAATRCHSPGQSHGTFNSLCQVSSYMQGSCLWLLLVNAGGANFFPTNGSSFQTAANITATASESSFKAILALLPLFHLVPKLCLANHTPRNPFSCLPARALQSGPAYFADFYMLVHHPPHSYSTFNSLWAVS